MLNPDFIFPFESPIHLFLLPPKPLFFQFISYLLLRPPPSPILISLKSTNHSLTHSVCHSVSWIPSLHTSFTVLSPLSLSKLSFHPSFPHWLLLLDLLQSPVVLRSCPQDPVYLKHLKWISSSMKHIWPTDFCLSVTNSSWVSPSVQCTVTGLRASHHLMSAAQSRDRKHTYK